MYIVYYELEIQRTSLFVIFRTTGKMFVSTRKFIIYKSTWNSKLTYKSIAASKFYILDDSPAATVNS